MTMSDAIARRALRWVLDLGDPECTAAELAGLDAWLAEDPEHARAFWTMEAAWRAASRAAQRKDAAERMCFLQRGMEFESGLRACLEGYTQNASDIDELLQETYVRLLKVGRRPARDEEAVRAFLLNVAQNVGENWRAHRSQDYAERTAHLPGLDVADERANIERILSGREDLALLSQVKSKLPPRCREVFTLRKIYGYSSLEIALWLKISERTVEMHLAKAARYVAEMLRGTRCTPPAESRTGRRTAVDRGDGGEVQLRR